MARTGSVEDTAKYTVVLTIMMQFLAPLIPEAHRAAWAPGVAFAVALLLATQLVQPPFHRYFVKWIVGAALLVGSANGATNLAANAEASVSSGIVAEASWLPLPPRAEDTAAPEEPKPKPTRIVRW